MEIKKHDYPTSIKYLKRTEYFLFFLIFLGFVGRICWIVFTKFIEEDAFITFRIAKNLAEGAGFVYNSGERVLGTTTPLYTLLISGWIKAISADVIVGTRILNLATSTCSLILLLLIMRKTKSTKFQQVIVLIVFAFSSKLYWLETGGMETSFVIFLMIASWYTFIERRLLCTGIILGLLVMTRLDLFVWPISLLIIEFISNPKQALRVGVIIFLVNLPWILFAIIYFGSPIPHTIFAKWVAYIQPDHSPLLSHLMTAINFMSPFDQYKEHIFLRNLLAWMTLMIAAWQTTKIFREKYQILVSLFIVLDILRLVLTRSTFFNRYFAPSLVIVLILFGLGLGNLWESIKSFSLHLKTLFYFALISMAAIGLVFGVYSANQTKIKQEYRFESSLKQVGLWLNQNAAYDKTVLLEPLGYSGYYSDRFMLDEVGLVTPRVVELKQLGISASEYLAWFNLN